MREREREKTTTDAKFDDQTCRMRNNGSDHLSREPKTSTQTAGQARQMIREVRTTTTGM